MRARYAAEYERTTVNANLSMETGQIDAMIDPEQTRGALVEGLKDVEQVRARYAAEYERTTVNANLSMETGQIDAMIDPEQTRGALVEGLKLLAGKRRVRATSRHHGNQPL